MDDDEQRPGVTFIIVDIEVISMATGMTMFDNTFRKTEDWFIEIMHELGLSDEEKAYRVLRNTLHTLRDRITVDEAAQLGAQFPLLIKGIYYDGWDPSASPVKMSKQEFIDRACGDFHDDIELGTIHPEDIVRAVFRVIMRKTGEGELVDIRAMLPKDMKGLIE